MHQKNNLNHTPVLLSEVLKYLDPKPGESYLDMTAGYGGHAKTVRQYIDDGPMVLVDRDQMAIVYLRQHLAGKHTKLRHESFLQAALALQKNGDTFDMILADLGVSSPHLNIASRGFALLQDGPLDMRMDQRQELRAETIVNNYSTVELEKILREYGEEPKARQIARAIVEARPVQSTTELANIVKKHWGHSKVHPATRTFQALRIAVNDELGMLKQALPIWVELLAPGGRLAVISFHSLEDRIVKQVFKHYGGLQYDAQLQLLTKRPVVAGRHETVLNPRARSAKLRVAVKIKNKKEGRL